MADEFPSVPELQLNRVVPRKTAPARARSITFVRELPLRPPPPAAQHKGPITRAFLAVLEALLWSYRRRLRGIGCFRCGCAERMSETFLEPITRRLDGLQNNVSGLNRRMIMLESNLIDRVGALEARMAELEKCTERLADHISALETGVNCLILLIERIAKVQGLTIESDTSALRSPPG